jgi:RNA polymerase sigma factor (sigma-70 family)
MMRKQELHLIDINGNSVAPSIRAAVEFAYRWVKKDYPQADPAVIANLAERLATSMEMNKETLWSARRYATSALHRQVRHWLRNKSEQEIAVGLERELEQWAGPNDEFQRAIDREMLFQHLKSTLNERDRSILVMLIRSNANPSEVATALGISTDAATKAIQRVRERVAHSLSAAGVLKRSPEVQRTTGLERKWTY